MTLFDTVHLELLLGQLAEEVRAGYVEGLAKHDRHASGNLMSTVRTEVELRGTRYEVSLWLQDYWKYVEEGTRPHWPPRDAILKWITVKGIIPRPDNRGRIPSPQSLAFLISRKISRVGTEGSHDLQTAKDEILPTWEERIAEALHRDALDYIEKVMAE